MTGHFICLGQEGYTERDHERPRLDFPGLSSICSARLINGSRHSTPYPVLIITVFTSAGNSTRITLRYSTIVTLWTSVTPSTHIAITASQNCSRIATRSFTFFFAIIMRFRSRIVHSFVFASLVYMFSTSSFLMVIVTFDFLFVHHPWILLIQHCSLASLCILPYSVF